MLRQHIAVDAIARNRWITATVDRAMLKSPAIARLANLEHQAILAPPVVPEDLGATLGDLALPVGPEDLGAILANLAPPVDLEETQVAPGTQDRPLVCPA